MSNKQSGFSLIELMIVIALVGLVGTMFYNFFNINLGSYLRLQADASEAATVASQSQRVANVVRGTTGIVSVDANDLVIYAYFYPSDSYVSLVHYYLNTDKTILYCDVTPMTSNPPVGTPIPAQLKTYTIAENFKLANGQSLFNYLGTSYNTLPLPVTDLNAIKVVQTNLAVVDSAGVTQNLSLQIALRNRKTNL